MIERAKAPLAQYRYLVAAWPHGLGSASLRFGSDDLEAARRQAKKSPQWEIGEWNPSIGRHVMIEES